MSKSYTFRITRPYAKGSASRPGLPYHSITLGGRTFTEAGESAPATDAELSHVVNVVSSRFVRHSPDGRGEIVAASTFDRDADGAFVETPVESFKHREGDEPLSRFVEVVDEDGRVVALD